MALPRRQPVPSVVGQRMTLKDFLKLPEEKPYLELREGIVTQKMPPQERHAFLAAVVIELINAFARRRRLAMAIPELRCLFGNSYLVPDVAIYRWDRLRRRPDGQVENAYVGPPDVVVEILSPGQSLNALVDKCRFYTAHGVPIVLLVHPASESVRMFLADGSDTTLRGDDRIDLDSVLPGFDLTVRMVFDTLVD